MKSVGPHSFEPAVHTRGGHPGRRSVDRGLEAVSESLSPSVEGARERREPRRGGRGEARVAGEGREPLCGGAGAEPPAANSDEVQNTNPSVSNTRVQTPVRNDQHSKPRTSRSRESRELHALSEPLLLQCRIDALHIAYQADLERQILIELNSAQGRARRLGSAQAFYVAGTPFALHASGGGQKPFRLTNAHASITVGDDRYGFTVVVEFRAVFLATASLADTLDVAEVIARHFTEKPLGESRVRRLDLCADVTNVEYSSEDLENFVGRPRKSVEYHAAQASARLTRSGPIHTGFTFSKGNPTMARLYNKTEELDCYDSDDEKVLTETAAFRAAGWNGSTAVWRLEAQLKSPALKSFEATEPAGLASKLDGIWRYLFVGSSQKGAWLRLVDPSTATRRERCALDQRWAIFHTAQFMSSANTPVQRVLGRRRGLSVPEAIGSLLSHLGSAGRLQTLDCEEPMAQLSLDLEAFYEQVGASHVAHDYHTRRATAAARFAGIRLPQRKEDIASVNDVADVVPPTPEERKTLTFLQYVRSREADFFMSAPDFQREPTFDERPQFVARRRYYEQRLGAYSQAWRSASLRRPGEPDPQHRLPFLTKLERGAR
jgi:hypothetical protein